MRVHPQERETCIGDWLNLHVTVAVDRAQSCCPFRRLSEPLLVGTFPQRVNAVKASPPDLKARSPMLARTSVSNGWLFKCYPFLCALILFLPRPTGRRQMMYSAPGLLQSPR